MDKQLFGLTENTPIHGSPTVAKTYYRLDWEGDNEEGIPTKFYWVYDNLEECAATMGIGIDYDFSLQFSRLQMVELFVWGEPRFTDLWTYFPLPSPMLFPPQGEPINAEILANHIPVRGEPSPYDFTPDGSEGNWWEYLDGGIVGAESPKFPPDAQEDLESIYHKKTYPLPTFPDGTQYGNDWGAVVKYVSANLGGMRIYSGGGNVMEVEIFSSNKWGEQLELWGDLIPIESPEMILTNMDLAEIFAIRANEGSR